MKRFFIILITVFILAVLSVPSFANDYEDGYTAGSKYGADTGYSSGYDIGSSGEEYNSSLDWSASQFDIFEEHANGNAEYRSGFREGYKHNYSVAYEKGYHEGCQEYSEQKESDAKKEKYRPLAIIGIVAIVGISLLVLYLRSR